MLALACAARASSEDTGADLLTGWPDPLPLPLLLTANEIALALARTDAAPHEGQLPTLSAFWNAIEEWLRYSDLAALVPTIQRLLDHGGCLVMIDGLDDLPPAASRHAFVAALARFVARYPSNRYVITCRSRDPGLLAPLASFARYTLPDLDDAQAGALMARWYAAVADRAGLLLPEDVGARVAALQAALQGDARLRDLARDPLALTLCVLAHAEGHALPADRGVVLRRLADLLASGWSHGRLEAAQSVGGALDAGALALPERRLALLAPLGMAFLSRPAPAGEQPVTLTRAEVEAAMAEGLAEAGVEHAHARDSLIPSVVAACCRHGLLARAGHDAYALPNPHARDALATLALVAQPDFPTRAYALRHDPRWHEALLLAQHELRRRSTPHVGRLLIRLLLHPPAGALAADTADLLLAAECLIEIDDRSHSARALRVEIQERLITLLETPDRPIAARVQAGLLLGYLGDPRLSEPPPLVHVAAGPFTLGTSDGYDDEGPPQRIDLPSFAIGMHPVTNFEYAVFLAENANQPKPRYWHDPRFNNPACPVVGVTWHEAAAYCAWLTRRLERFGLLKDGAVVRLPTEFEWEKAASWDALNNAKRRYPWGDEWDSARANTADRQGTWFTSPIGSFLAGVSPYGLYDCIGNVWEWTASAYASYPGAAAAFHEVGSYTLRGSSCASNPTHARCTYRSRLPAGYWRYHLGFRIVVGQPL
jgi:formylglycine-generating enzyme required for sulfatase activity